jgi:PAS domain S-box-containing protein
MLMYKSDRRDSRYFERSAIPAVVVDGEGTIRAINQPAQRFFSYTSDELAGLNVGTLVPDVPFTSFSGFDASRDRILTHKKTGSRVLRAIQRTGKIIPVVIVTDACKGALFLLRFVCTATQ